MRKERDIVFEQGQFWVARTDKGFEVYRAGATHSVRCAIIGFKGDEGFKRAKAEIERRLQAEMDAFERGNAAYAASFAK